MRNRLIIVAVAAFMAMAFALVGCAESDEMKQAKADFTAISETVTNQIKEINGTIEETETIVYGEEKPLDESLVPATETAISEAKAAIIEVPKMPSKLEDITAKTEELQALNLQETIDNLNAAKTNLSNSIEQRKLVTEPTEAFVLERLGNVDGSLIDGIAALTEETDTNKLLGKEGSYYSKIIFSSPKINKSQFSYKDDQSIAGIGVDGGGTIEVFYTEADAQKRSDYLGTFDGAGAFDSGSHKVIGTVLVRTSHELTASQQKELETAVIEALTALN